MGRFRNRQESSSESYERPRVLGRTREALGCLRKRVQPRRCPAPVFVPEESSKLKDKPKKLKLLRNNYSLNIPNLNQEVTIEFQGTDKKSKQLLTIKPGEEINKTIPGIGKITVSDNACQIDLEDSFCGAVLVDEENGDQRWTEYFAKPVALERNDRSLRIAKLTQPVDIEIKDNNGNRLNYFRIRPGQNINGNLSGGFTFLKQDGDYFEIIMDDDFSGSVLIDETVGEDDQIKKWTEEFTTTATPIKRPVQKPNTPAQYTTTTRRTGPIRRFVQKIRSRRRR